MAPSSPYKDLILGRKGDPAPPVGGSRALRLGEQAEGTETPNSQYCHSQEASECLCCLLDMDPPPHTHTHTHLSMPATTDTASLTSCLPSPRSASLCRNSTPNLIKVGFFPLSKGITLTSCSENGQKHPFIDSFVARRESSLKLKSYG